MPSRLIASRRSTPLEWSTRPPAPLERPTGMNRRVFHGLARNCATLLRVTVVADRIWTPRPGGFGCGVGCDMVEIILSEHQLARLKEAVPKGSIERAALEGGDYFAWSEITEEPIAVT